MRAVLRGRTKAYGEALMSTGTLPELEYPRDWPENVHVVGPLMWEPPFEPIDPPPGDDPLVLIAPSTVATHVQNAMTKLEADTRTQAVASALRQALIS